MSSTISLATLVALRVKTGAPVVDEVIAAPTTVTEPAVKVPTCTTFNVCAEDTAAVFWAMPLCSCVPAALVKQILRTVLPLRTEVMPAAGS